MRYVIFLIVLVLSSPAHAYSKYGHVAICELAYRELTDTARSEINWLLAVEMDREGFQHTSFNRSCLDADDWPWERLWAHFLNVSRDMQAITGPTCGEAEGCVLSAIDDEFQTLSNPGASDVDKSLSLRFIGRRIGDVHQPLHVSCKDDRGGNSIKKRGRCSAQNLHAVWDNCIVERRVLDFGFFTRVPGFAKFTKVYRAVDRMEAEITDDERKRPGDERASRMGGGVLSGGHHGCGRILSQAQ